MDKLNDGIILYHGSYCVVDKINLSKCYRGKDFGKGFYLTTSYEQAKKFEDQYCFRDDRAISCLHFQNAEEILI